MADKVELGYKLSELVWVCVSLWNANPILIGAYYHPRHGSCSDLDDLEHALDQLMSWMKKNSKTSLVIACDFSVGDIDWKALAVKPQSCKNSTCEIIAKAY